MVQAPGGVRLVVVALALVLLAGERGVTADPEPLTAPPTTSAMPAPSPALLYYVKPLATGGSEAFLYRQGGAPEPVGATAPGDLPLELQLLPTSLRALTAPTRLDRAPSARPVYVDSASGSVLHPAAVLDVGPNPRRLLLDLVGERALVLEFETDEHAQVADTTARLYLYQDTRPTTLGQVYVGHPRNALGEPPFLALSADREHLFWLGPAGAFQADLSTARVEPRPDLTVPRSSLPAWVFNPWEYTADGWRLQPPVSQSALPEWRISPGGTYHLLVDTETQERPRERVVVAPGREPSEQEYALEGGWVIRGKDASYWTSDWRGGDTPYYYRLRVGESERFDVDQPVSMVRPLSLEAGGRLELLLAPQRPTETDVEGYWDRLLRQELRITNFAGGCLGSAGALYLDWGTWPPILKWGAVWPIDRDGEDGVLQRMDYMTAKLETVLRGRHLRMYAWGETLVAVAGYDDDEPYGAQARFDLWVAEDQGRQWRQIETQVSEVRIAEHGYVAHTFGHRPVRF